MRTRLDLVRPRSWTVRVRSAVASTMVVAVCLILAGGALSAVLFTSLESSARAAADARAEQIAERLDTQAASDVDDSLLATDGQIGIVQIVDSSAVVVARSQGDVGGPLSTAALEPATTRELGRVDMGARGDYWVSGRGVTSPFGSFSVLVGADREPVEEVVTTVAILLVAVGPVVIALVAFATYRLVGAALSPVERMRLRVASISSRDLDERIPVPDARDEVARLAITLNEMLERLQAGQRAQQRFVSDASHELRSPLSTITAALELAASRPDLLDDALIGESLLPEAHRMRQLIDDLLLLARSDETARSRSSVDVDLDDLLYEECKRVAGMTDLEVGSALVPVRMAGDPDALARMVRNVVDNSVRHARGRIDLSCFEENGFATIIVDDDGPGIPEAQRVNVFDRFVRLDHSRTRDEGGAGLGLAIVAGIVAAHGGAIVVTESPYRGARFDIRLPLHVCDSS
ncbi:signal transduction histidine kinase [Rhodococcus sp. 27YEA15]|uniref:sensor histidine kinase n=1 Tax=Rhodococcus sp. 27YEA15 TaxID=3156259 RepID=UPI003C7A442B